MRRWFIEGLVLTNVLTLLGVATLVVALLSDATGARITFGFMAALALFGSVLVCRALLQSYEHTRRLFKESLSRA